MDQPLPWEPDESPSPAQPPVQHGVSGPMKWNRSKKSLATVRCAVQSPESLHWGPHFVQKMKRFVLAELASIRSVKLSLKATQSRLQSVLSGPAVVEPDTEEQG